MTYKEQKGQSRRWCAVRYIFQALGQRAFQSPSRSLLSSDSLIANMQPSVLHTRVHQRAIH